MKLYGIDENDIREILRAARTIPSEPRGSIIAGSSSGKYKFPLKIVYSIEKNSIVVVTAYPLKRKHGDENLLR
jgi:hypothetical protein